LKERLGRDWWRVRKTVDDNGAVAQTRFLYDLGGRLIAETDAAGTVLREYLWLGDTPVGFVAQAQGASGRSLFFVHADHLDTARVITDASGQVAWQALREPFGATTVLAGNPLDWPLRFPGQYLDSETGWHYNYFRDYDARIGRYIESDPIGLDGGINSYGYVDASPVGYTDRYGLTKEGAAVGAAIGGAIAIGGSVVVDAATGGLNVLVTPAEVAAGAAAGAALGDASAICALAMTVNAKIILPPIHQPATASREFAEQRQVPCVMPLRQSAIPLAWRAGQFLL
jgi:RHS repeat-associated protein